jgi:hypothetical protein
VNALLHPTGPGPQPPSYYWRNRAIFLLGAIVVVVIFVLIIKACGGSEPKAKKTPTATPTTLAALDTFSPPPEVADCAKADLKVELAPTTYSFDSGAPIVFTANVTNTGSTACAVDPAAISLHVTSGSDRIFDSQDCPDGVDTQDDQELFDDPEATTDDSANLDNQLADGLVAATDGSESDNLPPANDLSGLISPQLVLLQPSASEPITVTWNGQRSSETCQADLPAPGRPGTYHVVATVNGAESDDTRFELR